MWSYDEQWFTNVVGQVFYDLYKQAGRVFGDDAQSFAWPGRVLADIYQSNMNPDVSLQKHANECADSLGVPRPFKFPSRDRIIHVRGNFCNLRDAEDIPIFDAFINYLIINHLSKAEDWIARLKDAGSTHINTGLSGDYSENLGWANRYPIPGMDFTKDLDSFKRVLDYLIDSNLIPIVHLAMDGQGYDPIGWTYGWKWGMQNIPDIIRSLGDYIQQCLWNTGWDGCFPDWTVRQTTSALQLLRDCLGQNGQLSTEFGGPYDASMGYCHMGQGALDWTLPGMIELDAFFIEVLKYPPQEDGVAQTATRLLGPAAKNCPNTPYYLQHARPRGECAIVMFETNAYPSIRKQINPSDARMWNATCAKYGFTDFGNGMPS